MSDEGLNGESGEPVIDMRRTAVIGLVAAAVVVLFVTTISIILVFALRSDVSALQDQARRTAKATKVVQEELASIKDNLKSADRKSSGGSGAKTIHLDAADPAHDGRNRLGQLMPPKQLAAERPGRRIAAAAP